MRRTPSSTSALQRRITWIAACIVTLCAAGIVGVVAATATSRPAKLGKVGAAMVTARADVSTSIERARMRAPRARDGRCASTVAVPGQGKSCRASDGMYVLDVGGSDVVTTHGPDLVSSSQVAQAGAELAEPDVAFGTISNIVCSATDRTRAVQLAYLLPSDYATAAAGHGDRYAATVPHLRQALYDAAAVVDDRAIGLNGATRRRIRTACTLTGEPSVMRIVLPRTAAAYSASSGGFGLMLADLETAKIVPSYGGFAQGRLPAVRRLLAYYDADFVSGVAGQGSMYTRAMLMSGSGYEDGDPEISRTTRNINNNPPQGSLAIQYATRYSGVISEPSYNTLLHELSHNMGAVQDEVPTATLGQHCTDGLDIMCYDDGGNNGAAYSDSECPAVGAPTPEDEIYDCKEDTYFHPSPPGGSPLNEPEVWHLGLTANETFTADTDPTPQPSPPASVTTTGSGTTIRVNWSPLVAESGRVSELWMQRGASSWIRLTRTTGTTYVPAVAPSTAYEFAIRGVDANGDQGEVRVTGRVTGVDTTRPTAATNLRRYARQRRALRVQFTRATDNAAVTRYRVERYARGAWRTASAFAAPSRVTVRSPWVSNLPAGSTQLVRIRAIDARGNVGPASRLLRVSLVS